MQRFVTLPVVALNILQKEDRNILLLPGRRRRAFRSPEVRLRKTENRPSEQISAPPRPRRGGEGARLLGEPRLEQPHLLDLQVLGQACEPVGELGLRDALARKREPPEPQFRFDQAPAREREPLARLRGSPTAKLVIDHLQVPAPHEADGHRVAAAQRALGQSMWLVSVLNILCRQAQFPFLRFDVNG